VEDLLRLAQQLSPRQREAWLLCDLEIPAEIQRRLRGLPLPDAEPTWEEWRHHRLALLALASVLLLVFSLNVLEEPTGGRRLDLRSGSVHLVWVRNNASEASK
jgi:hypothetical protein